MRKSVPIRITSSDQKEYARLVRNAKAKIRRTNQKYQVDLTSDIKIPSINEFRTREEFNKWKQKMSSFTNRSNLKYQFEKNRYGVVATKKDLNRIRRDDEKALKIIEEKINQQKDKPFYVNGKMVGTQEFKSLWLAKPDIGGFYKWKPFDWENVRDKRAVANRLKRLDKVLEEDYFDKRTAKMKQNFIEELQFSFNSEADKVVDMLQYLRPDDFYELYNMFPDVFDFRLYSSENAGGADDTDDLVAMEAYLEDFFQGRIDMDFKGI